MRRIFGVLLLVLMLLANICAASDMKYLYTDALGSKIFVDTESIRPITYKTWDCYRGKTKLVFQQPMDKIVYSQLYYLVNKETREYAIVYIENYDAQDQLISAVDKTSVLQWSAYNNKDDRHLIVDEIVTYGTKGR